MLLRIEAAVEQDQKRSWEWFVNMELVLAQLFVPKLLTTFLTGIRGEGRKYAGNQISTQPPGHKTDTIYNAESVEKDRPSHPCSLILLWTLCPARVAQCWACRTHDLVVVSSIPSWGQLSFRRIFAIHLCRSMWEEYSVALETKFERSMRSKETHLRHRAPWYDLSC